MRDEHLVLNARVFLIGRIRLLLVGAVEKLGERLVERSSGSLSQTTGIFSTAGLAVGFFFTGAALPGTHAAAQ